MNSKKMEKKVSIAGYLRFFYSVESTFFVEYDDDDNQKSDDGGDNLNRKALVSMSHHGQFGL